MEYIELIEELPEELSFSERIRNVKLPEELSFAKKVMNENKSFVFLTIAYNTIYFTNNFNFKKKIKFLRK